MTCCCGCVNWHYTQRTDVSNDIKYQVAYKAGQHYRFIRDAVLVSYEPQDAAAPHLNLIWSIDHYTEMTRVPTTSESESSNWFFRKQLEGHLLLMSRIPAGTLFSIKRLEEVHEVRPFGWLSPFALEPLMTPEILAYTSPEGQNRIFGEVIAPLKHDISPVIVDRTWIFLPDDHLVERINP